MSRGVVPLRTEPLTDKASLVNLPWQAFFEALAAGDTGTSWTPTFVGLTEVGTATKTGKYYRISDSLAYYSILITPSTSTSSTAGVTYCDNFPLSIIAAGMSVTLSGSTAAINGVTTDKKIYTATWAAITTPITIIGILEVR